MLSKWSFSKGSIMTYFVLILFVMFSIGPLIWVFSTSLKSLTEVYAWPPKFIPDVPQWRNYLSIFEKRPMGAYIINGFIAASSATVISIFLAVPHAYAVSRFKFKGAQYSLFQVIAVRFFPPIAIALPFYMLYRKFGLVDTVSGVVLILTFLFEPFVVWIMKGFFDGVPRELEEAAWIDGCSKLKALWSIVLPLTRNGLAASAVFVWLFSWNEFVLVLALTNTPKSQTVPIGLVTFIADHWIEWPQMTAAAMIATVPAILIVFLFSEQLMSGLTKGSLD